MKMEVIVGKEDADKTSSRRMRRFVLIGLVCMVVATALFFVVSHYLVNRQYQEFETLSSSTRKDSLNVKYACLEGHIIKYSKDGISEETVEGKTLWSGSYDMSSPAVTACGEYILVYDIGGKSAMIFHDGDTGTEIRTDYVIGDGSVSRQGVVALLLQDTSSDVINLYNPYDVSSTLLAQVPTNVVDGYPVAMELSPDGTSLAVSYACVDSEEVWSRVSFYNFTDVGKNKDCLVGAQNYKGDLVTEIRFRGDSAVCLYSTNGVYYWKNMKQPQQVWKKKFDEQIYSVLYDEETVGVITQTGLARKPYRVRLYRKNGKKKVDFTIAVNYNQVSLSGGEVLLSDGQKCYIYRTNGVKKLDTEVEDGVDYFFPGSKAGRYYLITGQKIEEVTCR